MKTSEEIKENVKNKYSEIARGGSCCGSSCCGDTTNIMADDYSELKGYNPEADLNLGCGLPTKYAKIKEGDTVIDLGSGAGNDCFVARNECGASGKVYGVDFSEDMINRAKSNVEKLGYDNVAFIQGDIDNIPIEDETADVVISNCVLNLVPDKRKVYAEIMRVLKQGGHFSISDVVSIGSIPAQIKEAGELYVGCVAGATDKEEYLKIIEETGFKSIEIQKLTEVNIPNETMLMYVSHEQLTEFKNSGAGIYSITIHAEK